MSESFGAQTRSLPDQLRWSAEVELPKIESPGSVLVVGMGGSGICGDFASALAARRGRRVDVVKGYGLPGWAPIDKPLVVAVSYSGDTEETLAVVSEALEAGLTVVGISSGGELAARSLLHHVEVPGGNQPRASLGFLLGTLCRLLGTIGFELDADLGEAADVTEAVYAGETDIPTLRLVDQMAGRIPAIWAGSPLTSPVAQRWKTQMNENAKSPAWWSSLPEADHNEIVGWPAMQEVTIDKVVIVPLRDREDHTRVGERFRHTRRLTAPYVGWAEEVWSIGESPLARMLSLAATADLVTLELAGRYSVDPEAVALIEDLKQLLKEDS